MDYFNCGGGTFVDGCGGTRRNCRRCRGRDRPRSSSTGTNSSTTNDRGATNNRGVTNNRGGDNNNNNRGGRRGRGRGRRGGRGGEGGGRRGAEMFENVENDNENENELEIVDGNPQIEVDNDKRKTTFFCTWSIGRYPEVTVRDDILSYFADLDLENYVIAKEKHRNNISYHIHIFLKFKVPSFTKLLLLTFLNTRFGGIFNDIDIQVVKDESKCLHYITKSDRFFFV